MLPNNKPKKSKLKEKSKEKIKVTKDKIVKKKNNMDIQKLKKNKLNRVGSVVEDAMIKMNDLNPEVLVKKKKTRKLELKVEAMIKMNDLNPEVLVKKKKTRKLELKVEGKEEEKEVDTNNPGNTNSNEVDHDTLDCGNKKLEKEKKHKTCLKKKRRREKENAILPSSEDQVYDEEENDGDEINMLCHTNSDNGTKLKKKKKEKKEKKGKKMKRRKKDIKGMHIVEAHNKADESEAEEISLVDEDCTRGMKKWLVQYKEKRPGLNILQQRIDDYITSYEERLEQERKEREAKLDEEGWTIVMHHKGRKKTTDAESGISVGAVAQAALVDKLSQKKSKEAPLNFYRHQKREEHRNEVMKLQSKFEQDKKRVQEMKAARKFRPY